MRTVIISALFVVCGLLGFCCQMLYANYFGSGKEMDIYFSLLSIPAIITGATGTIFSSLFFPAFARIEKIGLDDYIYRIKIHVSRIALIIAIIGFAITFFNLNNIIETEDPFYYNLAFILSILFWFNSYLSIVNGYLASVQNYFKNFLIVSSTQLLVYFGIIIFVILFHDLLGVRSIAAGMIAASFLSLMINRYYGNIFHKSKAKVKVNGLGLFTSICLILISFLPFHAFASIAYMWAGQLDNAGCVSLLGYSHSFCGFLSTAASMGIATVSFPDLAKSLSSTDDTILHKGYLNFKNQLEVVIIFASYVAVFVSLFAHPIIELLFMRGQFEMKDVDGLSLVLPIYLINGVLIAMMNLTRNVYYSLNKQRLFAFVSAVVTMFFLLSSFALSKSVSYVFIGIVETISMGLFVLISLFFINTFNNIFDFRFVMRIVGQLFLLSIIGFFMFVIYERIDSFIISKPILIIICGVVYSLISDILLSTLIKSPIVLAINKKVANITKKCKNG